MYVSGEFAHFFQYSLLNYESLVSNGCHWQRKPSRYETHSEVEGWEVEENRGNNSVLIFWFSLLMLISGFLFSLSRDPGSINRTVETPRCPLGNTLLHAPGATGVLPATSRSRTGILCQTGQAGQKCHYTTQARETEVSGGHLWLCIM